MKCPDFNKKEYPSRVVLAGGNGFLGRMLARRLKTKGAEVTVLSRSPIPPESGVKAFRWDGTTLGPWMNSLEGVDAVINLAGRSVNCRYTETNRRLIMDSRVDSTRVIGEAIRACKRPPPVWLNSSTATIYKHSLLKPMDEYTGEIGPTLEAKDFFSVEVASEWEKTLKAANTPSTRKIPMRIAMVLGSAKGGVFRVLQRLVHLGLGGTMGSGHQFVSWIHEEDFCRAVEWLISKRDLTGAVNICAPHPVPNSTMMAELRKQCGIPFGLPARRWMLETGALVLRTETELIIKSRRVVPAKLMASGFAFRFPTLDEALQELCATMIAGR